MNSKIFSFASLCDSKRTAAERCYTPRHIYRKCFYGNSIIWFQKHYTRCQKLISEGLTDFIWLFFSVFLSLMFGSVQIKQEYSMEDRAHQNVAGNTTIEYPVFNAANIEYPYHQLPYFWNQSHSQSIQYIRDFSQKNESLARQDAPRVRLLFNNNAWTKIFVRPGVRYEPIIHSKTQARSTLINFCLMISIFLKNSNPWYINWEMLRHQYLSTFSSTYFFV